MKKLLRIGYYFFIGAVIAVGVLLLGSMVPIPGNFKVKIVLSGSMEPAIKTGSIVAIKPAPNYAVGDIITFGKDDKSHIPTTHRIVGVRAGAGEMLYTTKGDANEDKDGREVRRRDILGKAIFSVSYLGFILDAARKPLGLAFLVIVPAGVIIGDEGRKIFQEIKKIKKKNSAAGSENSGGPNAA